jgi:hypothetical protein
VRLERAFSVWQAKKYLWGINGHIMLLLVVKVTKHYFINCILFETDTSYDKACSSAERRTSAPLTPLLGRETSSRFAVSKLSSFP